MNNPICPICGEEDTILVVQTEKAYYPMTWINGETGKYLIASPITKYHQCGEVQYLCEACRATVDLEEIEKASLRKDTAHIGA